MGIQKFIIGSICSNEKTKEPFVKFISTRLNWWLHGKRKPPESFDSDELAAEVIRKVKEVGSHLPCHVLWSFTKSLANCWTCSQRLGGEAKPCPLCGLAAGDRVKHLIMCPTLSDALAVYCPVGYQGWPAKGRLPEALCLDEAGPNLVRIRLLFHDVCFNVYNTTKHSVHKASAAQSARARIRMICRESPRVKGFLKEFRDHQYD